MQLDEALQQIAVIRQQMARSELFRGYRALTVAFSGVVGIAAALMQSTWVSSPQAELGRYLALWMGAAGISVAAAGAEIAWRAWRAGPSLARQQTLLAVSQFVPSLVIGAVITACIAGAAPHVAWMLPGLWSLLFALGLFASCRSLPRAVFWVASFYALCGCAWLLWGQGERAFSPWMMGTSFGGGQLFGAAVLYWTLERNDGASSCE